MKPYATGAIIGAAALAVVAMGVLVRIQGSGESESSPGTAAVEPVGRRNTPRPGKSVRSERVQERLNDIRAGFQERRRTETGEPRRYNDQSAAPAAKAEARPAAPPPARPAAPAPAAPAASTPQVIQSEEQDIAALTKTLLTNPDPDERISAVFFLNTADPQVAVPALLQGVNDADPEVRLAVVEALGDYTDDLAPSMIEPVLGDSDPEVRFEALGILGEMETPEALNMVHRLLKDKDEDVRALAEGILDVASDQ